MPPFITLKTMAQKLGESGEEESAVSGDVLKGVCPITSSLLKWPFLKELLLYPRSSTMSLFARGSAAHFSVAHRS